MIYATIDANKHKCVLHHETFVHKQIAVFNQAVCKYLTLPRQLFFFLLIVMRRDRWQNQIDSEYIDIYVYTCMCTITKQKKKKVLTNKVVKWYERLVIVWCLTIYAYVCFGWIVVTIKISLTVSMWSSCEEEKINFRHSQWINSKPEMKLTLWGYCLSLSNIPFEFYINTFCKSTFACWLFSIQGIQ